MNHIYCCLFDKNYSVKGLSMIQSLQKFDPSACVYILALDTYTERLIGGLSQDNINLITLREIEDQDVLVAKANRGLVEYYWTLSSVLTSYVFKQFNQQFDTLTYLDSDIFFYSDPRVIFSQINAESSCIITPHNFSERLKDRIVNGKFCVQWVTFANNKEGERILFDWRSNCLDWCYYKLEDGKMVMRQPRSGPNGEKRESRLIFSNISEKGFDWVGGVYDFADEVYTSNWKIKARKYE